MPTAAECAAEIRTALAPLSPTAVASLPSQSGYAFQAYVFATLGQEKLNSGWRWMHPGPTDDPTFAAGAGATFAVAHDAYSWVRNGAQDRGLFQEVTVTGLSGSQHHLDGSLVSLLCGSHGYPSFTEVGTVLEMKNLGATVSVGTARDIVGLAFDLGAQLLAVPRPRVVLVSARNISEGALDLVDWFGQSSWENAHPQLTPVWPQWISRRLRLPRWLR